MAANVASALFKADSLLGDLLVSAIEGFASSLQDFDLAADQQPGKQEHLLH